MLTFKFLLFLTILSLTTAKLPCEYLSMIDGNLVLDPGIYLCLGPCPDKSVMNSPGIYIGTDQTLFFSAFTLLSKGTQLTLQRSDGTTVLSCDPKSCYASSASSLNMPTAALPPGFYLTGRPGMAPLSINDPWQATSTIDLVDGSSLQMISLMGVPSVTGWRLVVGNTSYAMTNQNQLVVGNVLASTIMANPGYSVLAEGPVLVRDAKKSCPIPLARPIVSHVVLIYESTPTPVGTICNLTSDKGAFSYTVPIATCLASPLTIPGKAFQFAYFFISGTTMQFYTDSLCNNPAGATQSIGKPCSGGNKKWSGIFFGGNPVMGV